MNLPQKLVCGRTMTVAPENFPCAERNGAPLYFCSSFCLEAYQADPERFFAAHSQKKLQHPPQELQP